MPRTKQHIDRERSQRLYEALPGDKTIRYGNLKNWQESLLESGYTPGSVNTFFPAAIRNLCEEAKVPGEKGNPKCLRKLYLTTRAGVESNIILLVEQAMERMLEQEQFSVGWDER